jgi:DNA-binding Lrp family transcriptional regulator
VETTEQVTAVQERPARVTLSDSTTVPELSELINMSPSEVIGELFRRGIVTNINAVLDFETAAILLADLEIEAELAPEVKPALTRPSRKRKSRSPTARSVHGRLWSPLWVTLTTGRLACSTQ